MPYIDSHAHLTGEGYSDEAIHAMIKKAHESGVERIVNICTDKASFERALALALPDNVAAIPPHDVHLSQDLLEEYFLLIEKQGESLLAIGETGLDQVNAEGLLEVQIGWFKRHIQLAEKYQKPLVIHCRNAFKELFSVLDDVRYQGPLLLHCFTGTEEEASELVRRGYLLSFSGILTFKKSEELRAIARRVPLKNIVIETDAPWLAPQSKRGQINEPANVIEVADTLRALKEEPVEEQIYNNTLSFFRL